MEVRILGPLAVTVDGRIRPIGGRRAQTVLAVLVLEANSCVPIERLVDAVWEHNPPTTARAQIQICVSGLRRRVVGAGAIHTQASGYVLELPPAQLDAAEFKRLAAEGELDLALSLWQGPALTGLSGAMIASYRQHLEEKRLTVIEERVRRDLSLGRHAHLVGELFKLVAEHPSREGLHAHLMLALYRSGRWAEALAAYRHARTTFVTELGVEPTDKLRRLEHAILTRDPCLDPPDSSVPAMTQPQLLPSDIADFTGRGGVVAQACRTLTADTAAVPLVAITGPPAIGKSVLAVHVAHRILDSYPDGQLYATLTAATPIEVLRHFLRCLGLAKVPDGTVDELAAMFRARLAGRRVLIVLDDVADAGHVSALLPGSATCGMIVTSRSALPELAGAERIRLGRLDLRDGTRLLTKVAGRAQVPFAARIVELCDGLPKALRGAGTRLAARPHWSSEQLAARLSDETKVLNELEIRSSFAGYHRLPAAARRLLCRMALLDAPDVPHWIGAALLSDGHCDVDDLSEQLIDSHLIEAVAAPVARYRMGNLVRAFAREQARHSEERSVRDSAVRRAFSAWIARGAIAPERDALLAGMHQAARLGWADFGWRLGLMLVPILEDRDTWQDALETALACARSAGNAHAEAELLRLGLSEVDLVEVGGVS